MLIETTTQDFEADVINATLPVLLTFHAEAWCVPCQRVAPILEEMAAERAGKITFLKLNIDADKETAAVYGVKSIPTILAFDEGSVVATRVGEFTKAELAAFINNNIS